MSEETPHPTRQEPNRNPRRDLSRLSSVTTAIHLLKTFSENDTELGISELAKRLGVAKSTVHRLTGSLLEEGLLDQNPENGRYSLGIGLFSLGSLVRSKLDVAADSKLYLNELRDLTQENVRLAVLDRQSVVFLHDFESPQTLRLRSGTGQLKPAFCTAEGICLLAGLSEKDLDRFFSQPRAARTEKTVTDEAELRERIGKVRRQGFAFEDEECDEGTRCIAAPIFNGEGRTVATVSIAGPRIRLRKRQLAQLAALAVETAQKISRKLGYDINAPIYV
ncbi:IclR family transcriptional regulator [Roseibium marinum]|uniref:DNA-binding IclR family transcriptional regulator n=1 Tax=Roseibium marinum TaxID=281252 RepID=A0A2S3V3I5_9HYPH|nr:IclR family transcriptional regulator [Roseibium marinum]POF34518.1 DNA-binding IclR family transcriptional regulator [Roseibium marinum]